MSATELPPVAELVPHRGEVLLLDRVLAHDGESTRVLVTAGSPGWLQRAGGAVPAWLALEYMAQCVAAHEGLLARAQGRPPPEGFLVAALGLRLERPSFAAGERLRVCARRARGRPGLGVLSHLCTLHADTADDTTDDGALLAEGRLSVSLPGPSRVTPHRVPPPQSTLSKPSKRG